MAYLPHDYNITCTCFRCKGIRNAPRTNKAKRGLLAKRPRKERLASRTEQNELYLDAGPSAWDDR